VSEIDLGGDTAYWRRRAEQAERGLLVARAEATSYGYAWALRDLAETSPWFERLSAALVQAADNIDKTHGINSSGASAPPGAVESSPAGR
jgi:hypothetical protein